MEWIGKWCDDTSSVRHLCSLLKENGIRAKTVSCCYVGMRNLKIVKEDVEKAKKLLPTLDPYNGEYIVSDCLE